MERHFLQVDGSPSWIRTNDQVINSREEPHPKTIKIQRFQCLASLTEGT